jgi:hypothetical protein
MALAHCILGKFLGVGCHYFPLLTKKKDKNGNDENKRKTIRERCAMKRTEMWEEDYKKNNTDNRGECKEDTRKQEKEQEEE